MTDLFKFTTLNSCKNFLLDPVADACSFLSQTTTEPDEQIVQLFTLNNCPGVYNLHHDTMNNNGGSSITELSSLSSSTVMAPQQKPQAYAPTTSQSFHVTLPRGEEETCLDSHQFVGPHSLYLIPGTHQYTDSIPNHCFPDGNPSALVNDQLSVYQTFGPTTQVYSSSADVDSCPLATTTVWLTTTSTTTLDGDNREYQSSPLNYSHHSALHHRQFLINPKSTGQTENGDFSQNDEPVVFESTTLPVQNQ